MDEQQVADAAFEIPSCCFVVPEHQDVVMASVAPKSFEYSSVGACHCYEFGDFAFVKCPLTRPALRCMFKIIESRGPESWELVKTFNLNTSSLHGPFSEFHPGAQCTEGCGHSGSSYTWTLATLARLAELGWPVFVDEFRTLQQQSQ